MKKKFLVKVTKQVTEWWTIEAYNEDDARIIYDISGDKILTKIKNEKIDVEENNDVKDGWDVLGR